MKRYLSLVLAVVAFIGCKCSNSALKIATWNSFDIYHSGDRDARRDYVFANVDELFGDLDILCTQEAFAYQSYADWATNLDDVFPYYYYHDDPSPDATTLYQACSDSEIESLFDNTSLIYECNSDCIDKLPSSISYVFCLWRCFGELRDANTGITTRDNNPELYDLGKLLELSPCLICLWKSKYVEPEVPIAWEANNSTKTEMFDDILNMCSLTTFDYKATEGVMLWSKYEFDDIEFVPIADAVFMPRGAIIGTFNDHTTSDFIEKGQSLSIICTHLETPSINSAFGSAFTTMIQDNIDNQVSELSNLTQVQVKQLANEINTIAANGGNVITLGDLNIGANSREDLYDELVSKAGLRNVLGSMSDALQAINCSRCETNPYTSSQEIIDHILMKDTTDSVFEVLEAERFMDDIVNNMALSDHYGIKAEVQLSAEANAATKGGSIWMIVAVGFMALFV